MFCPMAVTNSTLLVFDSLAVPYVLVIAIRTDLMAGDIAMKASCRAFTFR